MVSYEDFYSGKVVFATPYGREELTPLGLSMWDERTYDVLKKVAYFLRPDKIKAIGLDKREGVVYVAVEHKGYTYAGCGNYYVERNGGVVATSDSFASEAQGFGSFEQKCPLSVLEQLSPLSDFSCWYDEEQRQRAKQWRQICLKKILRSRKTSDDDKVVARKLLDELKAD